MDILHCLDDKTLKPLEKRAWIAQAINARQITIKELQALRPALSDKKMTLVLEAMEAITNANPTAADLEWLFFAQDFILSPSNGLKREASRIVGNIAHLFPDDLGAAIERLLENAKDSGTVVRWSSAYAMARIIRIPQYANSELYDALVRASEQEQESGVKNQLLGGLKKAHRVRK